MAIEKTYSMLRSPTLCTNHHIGEIVSHRARWPRYRAHGAGQCYPEQAADYAEHEGKPFYNGLIRVHHQRRL